MDILNKNSPLTGIQIQVKPLKNGKGSKSFTVHNVEVDDAISRISFMFEQLSRKEDKITIVFYKKPKNALEETA